MEDMFDVGGDVPTFDDEDSMLDFEPGLEPQMRSRAYTWPTRPPDSTLIGDRPNFSPGTAGGEMAAAMAVGDGMQLQPCDSRGDAPLSPDGSAASRKVSSRRNAWGSMSYADLITKAIESSPEKRLTLSQIYAWMVANVPFFHDKGDSNSSAGWKNSIRHNLSLHSRFMRVQNEGTGKSSWWMVNTDTVSKLPRKRAGTMDATSGYRRPTKPGKRLPGVLKHARSTELHGEDLSEPGLSSVPQLGDPISFGSPRMRASSGNSSNSGCSPAALGTPQESDGGPCFTIPQSWEVFPKHETLSESLADIFISDAAYNVAAVGPAGQPAPLYVTIQQPQAQPVFVTNEAYAHGVPIHQPSPQQHAAAQQPSILLQQQQQEQSFARFNAPPSSNAVAFQSSVHNVPGGGGGGMGGLPQTSSDHVPTLGELLQDQRPGAGYLLHSYLTSGGSVSTQAAGPGWGTSAPCPEIPLQSSAAAGQAGSGNPAGVPPARRPFPINQKLLMQLLVTKPHLATRLQQLIEAKRRQLTAMQQSPNSSAVPPEQQQQQQSLPMQQRQAQSTHPEAAGQNAHSTMLQQLLTAVPATNQTVASSSNSTPLSSSGSINAEIFPPDLDLSLLDQYSTSDINCDIEQVIQHELSFGDKLDFSFDQLHLDEFGADFAN